MQNRPPLNWNFVWDTDFYVVLATGSENERILVIQLSLLEISGLKVHLFFRHPSFYMHFIQLDGLRFFVLYVVL